MWILGRLHKPQDDRDRLITELLKVVSDMAEAGAYLVAANDALRMHLKEVESEWKDCIDPDRNRHD